MPKISHRTEDDELPPSECRVNLKTEEPRDAECDILTVEEIGR